MKKEEIPQDKSAIMNITKELCYVKGEDGKYTTGLSTGWKIKSNALENAWDDINESLEIAKQEFLDNKKSPIEYLMIKNLMDLNLLSQFTGFWKISIKKHLKPEVFKKLSDKKLEKYAETFNISINDLKNFKF